MGNYRMCMCFIRTFKVMEPGPPNDVKDAFKTYADGGSHMTADQLRRFLIDFQGHNNFSAADTDKLVGQIMSKTHHIAMFTRHTLTLDDFHHFLFSVDLNPPVPLNEGLHDMTKPLSHYFIYTGHNSYLTGNQVSSDCSDVPIINALKRGVRVIELDLWPNSTKDDVHVLHGRTLTTPVELIRCLKSIKEHAFSFSPYPVIITIEDHLTPDLQAKVAWMITETFGNMLYIPEVESLEELPSPEDLKHRIIISTKPPKKYNKSPNNNIKNSDDESSTKAISDGDLSDSEESEESENELNSKPDEYKRLIAIHAGKLKNKEILRLDPNVRRLSLSEKKFKEATEVHGMDLIRFTQKNILRVFPHATRLNSSNYKPMLAWMHGAQMVAFNMQGYGKSLWLMHGMFRANGGSGYVKKPDFLMREDILFNPNMTLPVKIILKVKVYMGDGWHLDFKPTHFDAYSPPDFYTKVGIAGVQDDVKMEKTRIVEDNWWPVWDEEFIFPLTVPELALLRIEVHDYNMTEKDDFGGQVCYPVSELKQGIRTVPLFDRKGNKLNYSRLLMQFHLLAG